MLLTRRDFLLVGATVAASAAAGLGTSALLTALPKPTAAPAPATPGAPAAACTAVPARAVSAAAAPAPAAGEAAAPPVRPVTVALLSDTHVQAPGASAAGRVNPKLAAALADLQPLHPDLWLVSGDLAENGTVSQYAAFKEIVGQVVPAPKLAVTTGNHEFYDFTVSDDTALRRFREMFGVQQIYSSRIIGGIHLVLLADEAWHRMPTPPQRDWAWLSPEQLNWFEQVLRAHRDRFTAVCLHQPLQGTVADTLGTNPFGGTVQAAALRAILQRNPQVRLWFSGHTHLRLDAPGQVVRSGPTTFVALGSTAYLMDGSGRDQDFTASQSRVLEIYPDRVVVRTRDHAARAWLPQQQLTLPLL